MNEDVLVQYAPYTHQIVRVRKIVRETTNYYVIIVSGNYRYINKRTLNERANYYAKWHKMSKKELQEMVKHNKLVAIVRNTKWENVNTEKLQTIIKMLEK